MRYDWLLRLVPRSYWLIRLVPRCDWLLRLALRYTHKTSGFKTSGFKTSGFKMSETAGLQNVSFTKRQVYKMSGLLNVRSSKRPVAKKTSTYILYLWLVEIRRFCCRPVSRQSNGCVLFSILEGCFAIYHNKK